jgi:hypothetical protein
MSVTVWLCANTLTYPQGGGHLWVYLNWALGLKSLGCHVVWMEACDPAMPRERMQSLVEDLKHRLAPYGLAASISICSRNELSLPDGLTGGIDIEGAAEADLLVNMAYDTFAGSVRRFRRSALVDIDPGLLQNWLSEGVMSLPRHDIYFTTGETIISETGLQWERIVPCVALEWWPVRPTPAGAAFSTVSHWASSQEWVSYRGECYHNDKRSGFAPFLELPRRTDHPLELALCFGDDEAAERRVLEQHGWRVRHAHAVAATPWDYQRYIQDSRGEFSWVKPSCVRMQQGWISDRTLCYLASGKPVVVQYSGPNHLLPEAAGVFRFRDLNEAARCLEIVAADYERQCQLARALAEEHFSSHKVVKRLLEVALR